MKIDAKQFKTIVTMLKTMVDEIEVKVDEEGWHIYACSVDKVSLVSIDMGKDMFEDYACDKEVFNFDADKALKAIKDKGATLELKIGDMFVVKGDGITSKFALNVPTGVEPRFPKFQPETEVSVLSDQLKKILNAADEKACKEVRFIVSDGGLKVTVYDDVGNGSDLEVPAEECASLEGTASSGYSFNDVKAFVSNLPTGEFVTIKMDSDYPIYIEFESGHCKYKWASAPRISSD